MKDYATFFTGCAASFEVLNRLNSHVFSNLAASVLRAHNTHTHCFTRCCTHTQHTHTRRSSDRFSYQSLFLHITKKHRALAIKWTSWKKKSCLFLPLPHRGFNQENRQRVIPAIGWRWLEQFFEHKDLGVFLRHGSRNAIISFVGITILYWN